MSLVFRERYIELYSFSFQALIIAELPKQRREIIFNIQKLHGLYLGMIVLDKRKPTCSRGSKKRLMNKLFWRSFFQYSLKYKCSTNQSQTKFDCFWKCRVSKEVCPVVIQSHTQEVPVVILQTCTWEYASLCQLRLFFSSLMLNSVQPIALLSV